jgi:streptogrisin D
VATAALLATDVGRRGKQAFILTAGHCVTGKEFAWFADGNHTKILGKPVDYTFPGQDYALIEYSAAIARPGAVRLADGTTRDIAKVGTAVVGQKVERSGSTSGLHAGQVLGVNVTANFAQGTVTGLIKTDVCIEPGDSGGPLVAGNAALGIASGGRGNCVDGGQSYYQPVTEALAHYDVSIY